MSRPDYYAFYRIAANRPKPRGRRMGAAAEPRAARHAALGGRLCRAWLWMMLALCVAGTLAIVTMCADVAMGG